MRIIHFFLILTITICYGGLCNLSIASASPANEVKESCHNMDQHTESIPETIIEQENKRTEDVNLSCCNETITNNTSDQFVKVYYTNAPKLSIQNVVLSKRYKKISYRAIKEHDPPDLQVINSTFLI